MAAARDRIPPRPKGAARLAKSLRLPSKRLRWRCPESAIPRDAGSPPNRTVGQDRALEALRVGLEVRAPGYNIFVSGITGTGRTTTVLQLVKELAPSCPIPRDRAFVHNFAAPDRPRLLTLPAGRASALRRDVDDLVALIRRVLPASVEDREFHRRRDEVLKRAGDEERRLFDALRADLAKEGFALVESAGAAEGTKRLEVLPLLEGQPVDPERLRQLSETGELPPGDAEAKEARLLEHRRELAQILRRDRALGRETNDTIAKLLKETVKGALEGTFEDLRARNPEPEVQAFLAGLEEDVLENIVPLAREAAGGDDGEGGRLRLYGVHVLVDRRGLKGCPVVHETAPTLAGVFGTIERRPIAPGVFAADHTSIRSGSLLEADGGFFVIAAEDLLEDPPSAAALRRVLKHGRLEIRASDVIPGLAGPGLAPEAIEVDAKVILVGDWRLYEALYRASPEFGETFRVKADFSPDMEASIPNLRHFCRVASVLAKEEGSLPLARDAFPVLVENGVRASARQGRITTRFGEVEDLVREAGYWAAQEGARSISAAHLRRAAERRTERNRFAEGRIRDLMDNGVLRIETSGRRVGRVNGLSVYDLGYHSFGKPTLITASTGVGQAGIINVEREARLSGGIYDKGVLIIAGYLRRTFAQKRPLALSASVCFEQSYSGVDGDSASVAEVTALVSELSQLPVDQGIAVTGSLNQHGDVQPIGGVNQKIEGFYGLCRRRGLSGKQGVVIPLANVGDLMLEDEVVEACRKGKFSVWAVERVEEALAILLGADPGRQGLDGKWTPGSLYDLVDRRLRAYGARLSGPEDWKPIRAAGPGAPAAPRGQIAPRKSTKSK
ncbi:MAG TPA: AAA family ATPase [Planctomycetota bacterium]|nr:AAA family ATPase [Planctomycetota bacterium]